MRLYALLIAICCALRCHAVYVLQAKAQNAVQELEEVKEHLDSHKNKNEWHPNSYTAPTKAITNCSLSQDLIDEIRSYQDVVNQIIAFVTEGEYKGQAYDTLARLVDTYGPRLTGSGVMEAAIDFMLQWSRDEGLENVRTEDVVVPHWERNNESAWMVLPRLQKLNMLGLGDSVGTPPEGIRAEVLVVRDFDELEQNAALAAGRIVLYNLNYTSYGEMSVYRARGSAEAAKYGAVASLMSSLTDFSIYSPHTGDQYYLEGDAFVPAAAISVEDAAMMGRMQERASLALSVINPNYTCPQAKGKIVVYNQEWVSYGVTVQYRSQGASRAAKVGAVASLIRTIGPFSINSPHTGEQFYTTNVTIPTACITVEDAAMLQRLQDRGQTIEVLLTMGAINYPETTSRNTIAEVVGSEFPQETVVVSGHLDSWDVGQGAMDDGGGAMISWNAAVVLRKLGLVPKRTLRVILWTGEEQGIIGGQAYYNNHASEKDSFQLIMESDIGTFNPLGLAFSGNEEATCIMQEIMKLLAPLNTTEVVSPMDGGPDIGDWTRAGVPTGSLYNANEKYFWFHHSAGDTMSVEDPDTLDRCLALWTTVAYVTADISQRLPHQSVHDEL